MPDTSVLVAAAITPRGFCGHLLEAAIARHWLSKKEASRFVADVAVLADVMPDLPAASTRATADPKDEYFVTLARTAEVAAPISGDPHLTGLVELDPPVLTPAAFLKRLAG